jgi:hypothetical protein
MLDNIYISLGLSLDPATVITDEVRLREHLETTIKQWQNKGDRFKGEVTKARQYIANGFGNLRQQEKEARESMLSELRKQVNIAKKAGVVEERKKNIINTFSKYFSESTILSEFGEAQVADTGFPPKQPASLAQQCRKPVAYGEMKQIAEELKHVGMSTLYELLGLTQNATLQILQERAKIKSDEIHKMPKTTYEADVLNRLSAKFIYFKDVESKASYDFALKRFSFDKLCEDELNIYAQGFVKQQKTDWKLYQEAIRQTKLLGFSQAEADYLVYECFVIVKKCPVPVDPHRPKTPLSDDEIDDMFDKINMYEIF